LEFLKNYFSLEGENMQSVLDVSPGLMFWTLLNFLIFFVIFFFMFYKMIKKALNDREANIRNERESAEKANNEAQTARLKAEEAVGTVEKEIAEMKVQAKVQIDDLLKKATAEADAVKKSKVEQALRDIERSRDVAIMQLRTEIAGLVVQATEKILGESLDREKHYKIVEDFIQKIPNNN